MPLLDSSIFRLAQPTIIDLAEFGEKNNVFTFVYRAPSVEALPWFASLVELGYSFSSAKS